MRPYSPSKTKRGIMLLSRPFQLATNALLVLSLFLCSHDARSQTSGSDLESNDSTLTPTLLSAGERATIGDLNDRSKICTLTVTKPEHPQAPFIDKHPMRLTPVGIEVGVEGPTPQVGQPSKVVLNPIHNHRTAPSLTLSIKGPNGYLFESPVVMPVEKLEVCEPIPGYPNACNGPQALTRYHRAEVITPAWPHAGMYSIHIGPSKTDPPKKSWRGQGRHFEVKE
jgi:hypothetical protein